MKTKYKNPKIKAGNCGYFNLKILLFLILIFTLSCQRQLSIKFHKVEFDQVNFKKNAGNDSLTLTFKIIIPAKTVNKKAVMLIQPIFILKDTLRLRTRVIQGQNYYDGEAIPYKYSSSFPYQDKIKLPDSIDSVYKFQILVWGYKKGIATNYLGFEDKIIIK